MVLSNLFRILAKKLMKAQVNLLKGKQIQTNKTPNFNPHDI